MAHSQVPRLPAPVATILRLLLLLWCALHQRAVGMGTALMSLPSPLSLRRLAGRMARVPRPPTTPSLARATGSGRRATCTWALGRSRPPRRTRAPEHMSSYRYECNSACCCCCCCDGRWASRQPPRVTLLCAPAEVTRQLHVWSSQTKERGRSASLTRGRRYNFSEPDARCAGWRRGAGCCSGQGVAAAAAQTEWSQARPVRVLDAMLLLMIRLLFECASDFMSVQTCKRRARPRRLHRGMRLSVGAHTQ
jgi:hypothetical protein